MLSRCKHKIKFQCNCITKKKCLVSWCTTQMLSAMYTFSNTKKWLWVALFLWWSGHSPQPPFFLFLSLHLSMIGCWGLSKRNNIFTHNPLLHSVKLLCTGKFSSEGMANVFSILLIHSYDKGESMFLSQNIYPQSLYGGGLPLIQSLHILVLNHKNI